MGLWRKQLKFTYSKVVIKTLFWALKKTENTKKNSALMKSGEKIWNIYEMSEFNKCFGRKWRKEGESRRKEITILNSCHGNHHLEGGICAET